MNAAAFHLEEVRTKKKKKESEVIKKGPYLRPFVFAGCYIIQRRPGFFVVLVVVNFPVYKSR